MSEAKSSSKEISPTSGLEFYAQSAKKLLAANRVLGADEKKTASEKLDKVIDWLKSNASATKEQVQAQAKQLEIAVSGLGVKLGSAGGSLKGTAQQSGAKRSLSTPSGLHASGGQWILDGSGRVVIVHGVNMINKEGNYTIEETGFNEEDASILASNGLNIVRVGVIYSAVEPQAGKYDKAYMASIKRTVQLLHRFGISSLIDFHQDGWGPFFNCEGFPKWITNTNGVPFEGQSFPGMILESKALHEAFNNFWQNTQYEGQGMQDYFAAAWAFAAQELQGVEGIFGFEILNEPYPTTLVSVKEGRTLLTNFTNRVVQKIRTVDTTHMIFYEPYVSFDYDFPTDMGPIQDPVNQNLIGFCFHNYMDVKDPKSYYNVFQNGLNHSKAASVPLLLSEFGGDTQTPIEAAMVMTKQMESIDQAMLPFIYWAYWNRTPYPIVVGKKTIDAAAMGIVTYLDQPRVSPNLSLDKLRAAARVYPLYTAGTPISWSFDAQCNFYFEFQANTAISNQKTHIFVPAIRYPEGFWFAVSGATILQNDDDQILAIENDANAQVVSVYIGPGLLFPPKK